jgi:NitT/TauT family transport system substrate-binding protein
MRRMSARVLMLVVMLFMAGLLPVPVSRAQSPAPSAPVSEAKPELRIGYSAWVGYGPLFLAREKRYFDEAGVRVVLVKGRPLGQGDVWEMDAPKRRFAALADGRLDGLVTTVDTMTLYWKPTLQFQAVLGLADSNGGDGIIAKDSIQSIKELRGMKVAYNEGSVSHFFLSVLLRENGMTEKDIQGVNMRQDDAGKAFMRHQLDAAVTWEPWLTLAKQTPGGNVLVDSSSTPGLIMDVLLFRREVIQAHPDAIRAVIKGWYQAVEYWKKNPDESNALMAREVGDWLKDVKTFRETLKGVRYYDQAINEQYFAPGGQIYVTAQKAFEIWTALGKTNSSGTATDLIYPDFVRR